MEAVQAALKDAERMQTDSHCLDEISKGEVMLPLTPSPP